MVSHFIRKIFFLLVLVPFVLTAQESEVQNDFMTWTTFDLKNGLKQVVVGNRN